MNAWQWVGEQRWALGEHALQAVLDFAGRVELGPEMIRALHGAEPVETVLGRAGKAHGDNPRIKIHDGVAVIPVRGVIARYADRFSDYSGGTTVEHLARDFRAALDDPMVRGIVLEVDSPGGAAAGIGELAGQIRAARGTKPIVSYVGNLGASGAYWIASAADEIVSAPCGIIGSIGVVCSVDPPRSGERAPIIVKSTQSPRKWLDPRSEEGKDALQSEVDALAVVFVRAVAQYRGVSDSHVIEHYGQGGVLVGSDAVKAGMVDRLSTLEATIADVGRRANTNVSTFSMAAIADEDAMKVEEKWNLLTRMARALGLSSVTVGADGDPSEALAVVANLQPTEGPKIIEAEAIRMPSEQEIEARIAEKAEARAREMFRSQIEANCKARADEFVLAMVKAGRIDPSEGPDLAVLYADHAVEDIDRPLTVQVNGQSRPVSRVKSLEMRYEGRPANGWTEERIPADAKRLPESLRGMRILESMAPPVPGQDGTQAKAEKDRKAMVKAAFGEFADLFEE